MKITMLDVTTAQNSSNGAQSSKPQQNGSIANSRVSLTAKGQLTKVHIPPCSPRCQHSNPSYIAQQPFFGRQRFKISMNDLYPLAFPSHDYLVDVNEDADSIDELTEESKDSFAWRLQDIDYFLEKIPTSLGKLDAEISSHGILNEDLGELQSACSSLRGVNNQVQEYLSRATVYSRQHRKDIERVHRTLDSLTYLLRTIMHEVAYADELDQYGCLRAWMALNYAMETPLDSNGWMDDHSCQRRLMECKQMLLNCCDNEYVLLAHIRTLRLTMTTSSAVGDAQNRSQLRLSHDPLRNKSGIGYYQGQLFTAPLGF